ncbi:MAG TPA: hypothetical protein VIZ91_02220 [Solirubrobacterales bacterium]
MKLRTRKLAVFVTCLGVATAFPVLSSADKGGVPNSHSKKAKKVKICPTKGKGTKKDISDLPSQAQEKGNKCGFNKSVTTTVNTVAPTPSTTITAASTATTTVP